jgi:hypothetical protein
VGVPTGGGAAVAASSTAPVPASAAPPGVPAVPGPFPVPVPVPVAPVPGAAVTPPRASRGLCRSAADDPRARLGGHRARDEDAQYEGFSETDLHHVLAPRPTISKDAVTKARAKVHTFSTNPGSAAERGLAGLGGSCRGSAGQTGRTIRRRDGAQHNLKRRRRSYGALIRRRYLHPSGLNREHGRRCPDTGSRTIRPVGLRGLIAGC